MPESQEVTEAADTLEASIMSAQGIEGPTEAELRGDVDSGVDETETKETETEVTEVKTGEAEPKTEEEPKVTEEVAAISEPKTKVTPPGFVPLEAVHQARGEIKYLKEQLQTIQDQMQDMKAKPKPESSTEVADDFEVLTDEEFNFLAEDDATQAAIYLRNLNVHEASLRTKADDVKKQAEFTREYDAIIDTAVAKIEETVPGIYDTDSVVQKELMEFAGDLGFSEDLYYLTNPSTKVILPGESQPLLLGEQAASILGMLVKAKTKSAPTDNSALEASLRAEITAELMNKFKSQGSTEYKALNQVPKSEAGLPEGKGFSGKVLTTDQLLKLTDEEYESYLAGN